MFTAPLLCDGCRVVEGWNGMQVRHLAALKAIDSERSFRGAAETLGYVQSAVSQQISKLERVVGARLVERSRGQSHIELTAAGKLLLSHADRVLAQMHAAKLDLDAAAGGHVGALRVGSFENVAARVMPRVLSLLATKHAGLRVATSDAPSDSALFASVQQGELDVAFAELPLEPGTFEFRRLISQRCVLIGGCGLPVPDDRSPTLEELAALPLVAQPAWRKSLLIDGLFEDAGLKPDYRYESNSSAATVALAATGLAAAIVPRLALGDQPGDLKIVPLDFLPRSTLAAYWHSERTLHPALEVFLGAVEAVCARLTIAPAAPPARERESHAPRGRIDGELPVQLAAA